VGFNAAPPPFFSSGEISPFGQFQITNVKNIRCFFEVYNLPIFLKKNSKVIY